MPERFGDLSTGMMPFLCRMPLLMLLRKDCGQQGYFRVPEVMWVGIALYPAGLDDYREVFGGLLSFLPQVAN